MPDKRKRRVRLMRWLGCLGIALILAAVLFALLGRGQRVMTAEEAAGRLDSICDREGLISGQPWNGQNSASFAYRLGEMLFGQRDPMTAWTRYDTVPQAKAAGLRVGDILCTPGHAAVIYAVSDTGEIRTIECGDDGGHLIRRGGFYLDDPENTDFQRIADHCGFECLLTAPGNTGPVLWSGRLAALPEEPAITGATWPTVLSNGQFFGLRGTVSCRYPLTEIRAMVTNRVTGAVIFDVAVSPGDNVYAIGDPVTEPINEGLVFNDPECANSWLNYRLTASWDRDGGLHTAVLLDKNFRVGRPMTEEPDP